MSDTYPPSYRLMAEAEMRRLRRENAELKGEIARLLVIGQGADEEPRDHENDQS